MFTIVHNLKVIHIIYSILSECVLISTVNREIFVVKKSSSDRPADED